MNEIRVNKVFSRREMLRRMIGLAMTAASSSLAPTLIGQSITMAASQGNSCVPATPGATDFRFDRVALTIELETKCFEFDIGYLQGPAFYDIRWRRGR